MRVLDHQPGAWFLFEDEGRLYFDANCNHSILGYSWLIALDETETRRFEEGGRAYLDRLAEEIHNGAPTLEASVSPYKTRDLTKPLGPRVRAAVAAWRDAGGEGAVIGR